MNDAELSTRPYLIRAIHEWCVDHGFTPHIAVFADATVQVPRQYVEKGEIVLNIGADATSGLKLGNEWIEFSARFGGIPHQIMVPIDRVMAIYARENGQGMGFSIPASQDDEADDIIEDDEDTPTMQLVPPAPAEDSNDDPHTDPPPNKPKGGRHGTLKRIK